MLTSQPVTRRSLRRPIALRPPICTVLLSCCCLSLQENSDVSFLAPLFVLPFPAIRGRLRECAAGSKSPGRRSLSNRRRFLNKPDTRREGSSAATGSPILWSMPTTRDPFPFPHYENEETCTGNNRCSQKTPYCMPTHLAQQRDPWNRLHGTPTLASIRREVWYTEPEVSKDSLDFNLSALYNHHKDLLKDKSKVVLHKETLFDDHGQLKGLEPVKECTAPPIQHPTSKGISVRHWVNPVRESIHNIEGAIESHHTAATNSGYSRKENGGIFYH